MRGDGRVVSGGRYLSGLILCDFMLGVFLALLALAVSAAGFWNLEYDICPSVCVPALEGRASGDVSRAGTLSAQNVIEKMKRGLR